MSRSATLFWLAAWAGLLTAGQAQEICEDGGSGVFLPFIPNEHSWNNGLRACLYLAGLLWAFLGVGIIADTFMASIEVITSQETFTQTKTGATVPIKIWNATVANLTLMALGSSAPEILLNVIEIIGNSFFAGELGPSTIVGSAAFNLLVIIAVCVVAVPPSVVGGKKIEGLDVYFCTASFSVLAYVWLVIILLVNTPDRIDIWEAVVTLAFFPLLVLLAWLLDNQHLRIPGLPRPAQYITQIGTAHFHPYEIEARLRELEERFAHVPKEQREELIIAHLKARSKPSRAQYRMMAVRALTGGRRIKVQHPVDVALPEFEETKGMSAPDALDMEVNFGAGAYQVLEGDGKIDVEIVRSSTIGALSVDVATEGITATAGEDYHEVATTLHFAEGEACKILSITIIDDEEPEEDEMFVVKLSNPSTGRLGPEAVTIVTIIDDDLPGLVGFKDENTSVTVQESEGKAIVHVSRMNGSSGTVTVDYHTVDILAIGTDRAEGTKNSDYLRTSGTLEFKPKVNELPIPITLFDRKEYDKQDTFKVVLSNVRGPNEKAKLAQFNTCLVTIVNDEETKTSIERVMKVLNINADKYSVGTDTWKEQFTNALTVGGGGAFDEEDVQPGLADYVLHFISLPWKLAFATCPPTTYANGWWCFVVGLAYIGLVTALIGDLANLFGCVIGLDGEITAITFVALGTSLPDTFASRTAAVNDDNADASVGNVTGSNSVNVFLGLGLPWTIASIYWSVTGQNDAWRKRYGGDDDGWVKDDDTFVKNYVDDYPGGGFIVPAGSLGVSVIVFTICALLAIATLAYRRKVVGCELGGPEGPARATFVFFIMLWFAYIVISSLVAKDII